MAAPPSPPGKWMPADWMSQLPDAPSQLPLCQLALPGAHDSFASSFDLGHPLGPDSPEVLLALLNNRLGRRLVKRWSRTQSLSLGGQLAAGVRYLDLRVALIDGKFFLLHSLVAICVADALDEVSDFLNAHPGEAVLLDFNHFYCMDSLSDLLNFQQLVVSKLGSRLHRPVSDTLPSLTQLRSLGQSVLAFQCSQFDRRALPAFWENRWVPSPWPNTTDVGHMVAALGQTYSLEHGNNFLVLQAVLTPDAGFILKHPASTLQKSLSLPGNAACVDWLKSGKRSLGSCGVNIALTDFVEANGFLETVIGLNFA